MRSSLENKGYAEVGLDLASCECDCNFLQNLSRLNENLLTDGWRSDDLTYAWKDVVPIQIGKNLAAPLAFNLGTADNAKPVIYQLINQQN